MVAGGLRLGLAICVFLGAAVWGQQVEADFVFGGPSQHELLGEHFMQQAQARMQQMAASFEEAFNGQDASAPQKRGAPKMKEVHYRAPGMEVDVQLTIEGPSDNEEGEDFFSKIMGGVAKRVQKMKHSQILQESKPDVDVMMKNMAERQNRMASMFKRKTQKLRENLVRKVKHLQDGLPHWMEQLREEPRRLAKKQHRAMAYRTTLIAECPEANEICPAFKCPMKLTKCLQKRRAQVKAQCGEFLAKVDEHSSKKDAVKKAFKAAKHACKKKKKKKSKRKCKRAAKQDKHRKLDELDVELSSAFASKPEAIPALKATNEDAMEDAMEDTPAWIVGDIEEPQGEKDMGGWTMRVYTEEQQKRLNVDETGEAKVKKAASQSPDLLQELAAIPVPQDRQKDISSTTILFVALVSLMGVAVLALGAAHSRSRQLSHELSAVYGQAMGKVGAEEVGTSKDQV